MVRRSVPLAALAVVLLVSGTYLSVTVFAAGTAPAGDTFPGDPKGAIEPAPAEMPASSADPAAELVVVEVVLRARLLPAPALPELRLVDREGAPLPGRATVVAGTAAMPWAGAHGPQLLRFDRPAGAPVWCVVHLHGDEPAVEVALDGPHAARVRVVDAFGGPVPAVPVWFAGSSVVTDVRGEATAEGLPCALGVPVVVGPTERYAAQVLVLDLPQAAAAPALVALQDAVALDVRCTATPTDAASAVVLAPRSALGSASLAERNFPYFLPAVEAGAWQWRGSRAVLAGVPRGISLAVGLDDLGLVAAPTAVEATDGRPVFVAARAAATRRGRVLGADGVPICGAVVVAGSETSLAAAVRAGDGFLLPAQALAGGAAMACSDGDGAFAIACGDQPVLVVAPGHLAVEQRLRAGAVESVLLPPAAPLAAPELRLTASAAARVVVDRGSSRDAAVGIGPSAAHVLRLRQPALVDVAVRRGGNERRYSGLVVAGAVDLAIDG